MGNHVRISEIFLEKVAERLGNDSLVQRLVQESNCGIVVHDFKRSYQEGVRAELRAAKTDSGLILHRSRLGDAQFLPFFIRTRYPERIVGEHVPSHPSDAELVTAWESPY